VSPAILISSFVDILSSSKKIPVECLEIGRDVFLSDLHLRLSPNVIIFHLIRRYMVLAGNFSLHHRVQTGSEAHPAFYAMGTRDSFSGGKAVGVWSWPLTSI